MESRWCHSGPENGSESFDCRADFRGEKVVVWHWCELRDQHESLALWQQGRRHKAQWRAFRAPRGQEWTVSSSNDKLVNDIRRRGNNKGGGGVGCRGGGWVVNEERNWGHNILLYFLKVTTGCVCAPYWSAMWQVAFYVKSNQIKSSLFI